MTDFRADLHCHSTCSDGSLSPEEIVDLAIENELSGLSITDHDTIDAYESVIPYADEKGLDIIPGVEFSCEHNDKSIHILGYSFSIQNEGLQSFCKKHEKRRINRFHAMLEGLSKGKIPITEEEIRQLFSAKSLGRPHIARVLMDKGYVSSIEEAFKRFIGDDKPYFIKGSAFPVEETIDVIHEAGGLAIIAHPHLIKDRQVVRDLLKMNFDGLEGYYARFDQKFNDRWIEIAQDKNWLITGGSDFHGEMKPRIPLGCSWVGEETFNFLKSHLQKHK